MLSDLIATDTEEKAITMSTKKPIVVGLFLSLLFIVGKSELKLDFYERSCPKAETIVRSTVNKYISRSPSLAAPILRMHFHDCFVRGCDGSVLLNSTNNDAEKDAIANLSLRGFQVIDAAKAELEKQCPGVVSCADILALVTRDAVDMIGGPVWNVPMGRRDGVISLKRDASSLPSPFASFEQLKSSFAEKGLAVKDLVVLSGAHTIGTSHCGPFASRISGSRDSSLAELYAKKLRIKCKAGDSRSLVEMDPGSFRTFDNHYYVNLKRKRGLFASDAALVTDAEANTFLDSALESPNSNSSRSWFFTEFGISMEKMGTIDVLTGKAGQVRRHCAMVN